MRIKLQDESIRYKNFHPIEFWLHYFFIMEIEGLKCVRKNFYLNNREKLNKRQIIKKFIEFGVTKTTSYRWFNLLHDGAENFMVNNLGRPNI